MMETILITGGTGLIGEALANMAAAEGYKVIILSRKPQRAEREGIGYAAWDTGKGTYDSRAFAGADHVVHLAGANVAEKRWTERRKKEIVSSRVTSGELMVKALTETPNRIRTVVSASAIGWYGPDRVRPSTPFVESDPPNDDFLGDTCRRWEDSVLPVTALGKRLVILRTSLVLTNRGGAYPALTRSMKAGIATILGSGSQVISWIHLDDICRMYLHAIRNQALQGIYNAVAPETITNKDLVLRAARAQHRPFIPVHVPAFLIRLALGELSVEVLKSTTVDGTKMRNTGFTFVYPGVDAAIGALRAESTHG